MPSMTLAQGEARTLVWAGSTSAKVTFNPVSLKEAREWYRHAEAFERQTRQPRKQDGVIGRNGLKVLEAWLFCFLDHDTGRLDPGHAATAAKAGISLRSAARGIQALCRTGMVDKQRRCARAIGAAGQVTFRQVTNAYALRPPSQWKGYAEPPKAPRPHAGAWGAAPVIERGTVEAGTFDRDYEQLELAALAAGGDRLSAALAVGMRSLMQARNLTNPVHANLALNPVHTSLKIPMPRPQYAGSPNDIVAAHKRKVQLELMNRHRAR